MRCPVTNNGFRRQRGLRPPSFPPFSGASRTEVDDIEDLHGAVLGGGADDLPVPPRHRHPTHRSCRRQGGYIIRGNGHKKLHMSFLMKTMNPLARVARTDPNLNCDICGEPHYNQKKGPMVSNGSWEKKSLATVCFQVNEHSQPVNSNRFGGGR